MMGQPLHYVKKRTLKDIDEWLTPEQVYHLITSKTWEYKTNWDFYHRRDKALMSIYYLTCGRNNEPLKLAKHNFDLASNPDFVIVKNMRNSKRTKRTIAKYGAKVTLREPLKLPRFGRLAPFTALVEDHLSQLQDTDLLFPFKERRSLQIITHITGKWVHWFRAMGEAEYGKIFGDGVRLAKFVGVTNVSSVMPYIPFDEEQYERDLREKAK